MDEVYRRLIQRDEELAELRAIGDTMQSEFSRVLAALPTTNWADKAGYEAGMAALEGKRAIEKWTEARKQSR